jgi:molybdenum cofactor guanylyltransferase
VRQFRVVDLLGSGGAPLAGVVLAGGASRRMGRDKATMPHPGSAAPTMVEFTVSILARRCEPVFVVAAPGQLLPTLPGAVVLRDEVPGSGPLAATGLGLRASADAGAARAVVCAVDMPDLTGELIDALADQPDADVVLPWDGRDHYLAGIYRTDLAGRVAGLVAAGERGMRALTSSVSTRRLVLPPDLADAVRNVNSPADLVD